MATQKEMNERMLAAAKSGDVYTLQDCINKGAEVNCQNIISQTPLHVAAFWSTTGTVDLLLKAGASPFLVDYGGKTPLHKAAMGGKTGVVDLLLKAGASLSVVTNQGATPLHIAAMWCKTEVVVLLLKAGASPSVVTKQGATPLHAAAKGGCTEVVILLLKTGASLSVVTNQGQTPLLWAARWGRTDVVDLLLKEGASFSVVNKQGETPLHTAAMWGKTGVVDLLLKAGASLSVVNKKGQIPHDVAHDNVKELIQVDTPLHSAVTRGRTEEVDLLLKSGAPLSVVNRWGETPLHRAALNGNTEVVDILLKAGASLSVVNKQGETPLHSAALKGNAEVVDILLKSGASLSVVNKQGETPLQKAAQFGEKDSVDLLLKAGASLSVVDNDGETPIHRAALNGNTDVVDILLKAGASPSVVNKQGETPIHSAALKGNAEVVDILLKSGASLSVVNKQGETPLQKAAQFGEIDSVDLLLKAGASLSVVDNDGETPIHRAALNGNTEVVDILLKAGASPSVVNKQDETPLHSAALKGNAEVVDILLKAGASLSVVNKQGETPIHRAALNGNTGVVDILLKAGASPSVVNKQGETPLDTAALKGNTEAVDILFKAGASSSVVYNQRIFAAAESGDVDTLQDCINKGAEVNCQNRIGQTPLHVAAFYSKTVVDLLLKVGASLSAVDSQGATPLHTAAMWGKTEVADILLKAGASLSVVNTHGETPLHRAARWDRTEVTDLLIKAGASLSDVTKQGHTPLLLAARWGNTDSVDLLLKTRASLSVVNKQGETPLHTAAKWDKRGAVDLLLMAGASLSVVDKKGKTPHDVAHANMKELLQKSVAAALSGDVDTLLDCINKGEDVNCQATYSGQTLLHYAVKSGSTKVVDLLLKSRASLSVVDDEGETPLHSAALKGNTEVVDILLKAGASPFVVNKQGETPLHSAARKGNTEVVDILLKAGASPSVVNKQGKTPHDVARNNVKELLQKYAASRADMCLQFPMMTAEEINELISQGTFMAYENCVYLAGACNVGKSTLASIFLGEEIPQIWKSTDGLKIYFGRNGIHLKDKTMIPLEKGFDGDVLSKLLRGKPNMEQEKDPSTGESLPKQRKIMRPAPAAKEEMTSEKHPAAILSEKTDQALVKGASMEVTHIELSKPQLQARKVSKQSCIGIQEDIKEELIKGNYKVNIAPSDLVDFGGQKSFDMTHQLFIQCKGEFILMFNGRFDLCEPLPEYPQGDVTTQSILKHWVSSILSYCADDDDILPIILFAATHSDFYSQNDRIERKQRLIKDLKEMFQNHEQHKRIIYDDIFFINGLDKNDPEINRLKTKLVEVAFRQKSWGKRMPIAWVPLDLQFSEMRSHNTTLISKEDLTALNRSNEDLALTDDTQIEHFLKVQHSVGKILYFDQHGLEKFIIVRPQSLVNILRSFITDERFWPKENSLRDILPTMINTGEIAKKDLLKLWSQEEFHNHMPNNEFKEFIIQVLVHLDILVVPKRYSQEQKYNGQSYLVPCIVKRKLPFTDVYYKSVEDKMICLCYKVLKSSIPAALSFKLIGAAMNVWPLKESAEGVCLYHKAAILCIDRANELHISVKDNKIIIYLINKEAKRFIPPNIASTVQECLTLTLKKVLEFYHKSFGNALSTSEVSKLFEIEIGEWCDTGACYILVPEEKEMLEWRCKNKTHKTNFPLFWIFDITQDRCDERCTGFDTNDLGLRPTDQHLVRLAGLVAGAKFHELVIHLGLSNIAWENISTNYQEYDQTVVNFLALCKWRQQKNTGMDTTSFKDLSVALTAINHHTHVLCQVLRENVQVLGIDNIALQGIPDDDVLKELSAQVGNCAVQLGVELGLSMVEIEESRFRYSKDMFSQTFDVLKKWKRSREVKPTIRILMRALQASDPRGLMFLKDKYSLKLYTSTNNTVG